MKTLLLLLLALCLIAAQSPPQVVETGWHQDLNEPGKPGDEGVPRYQTLPPDPGAQPVPMPDINRRPSSPPGFKNQVVSYDPRTKVETLHEIPSGPSVPAQWVTGQALRDQVGGPDSWNNGISAQSASNHPWSTQCRMFMTIGTSNYVGSATILDMKGAITAGHCVHGGTGSVWATNVRVHPAWDGDADAWGSANGVRLSTFTAWTANSDNDFDIAYITFDRPVGVLTGTLGYGYDSNDSYYTSTLFNVAGYPGGTSYTGAPDQMYYAYGNYDTVTAHLLRASTNWPHRPGGMSGSGAYVLSGSDRFVHGVFSTASNNWGSPDRNITHCRITQAKHDTIRDSFIKNAYSTTVADYVPLAVKVTTPAAGVIAGDKVLTMNYRVCNASLFDPPNKTFYADVYLSTDDNISKADVRIQRHNFGYDFGPKSSVTVNVPLPTIPITTAPGKYWIGVILDEADGDPSNNETDGWDAAEITVLHRTPVIPEELDYPATEGNTSFHIPTRYAPNRSQLLYDRSILGNLPSGTIGALLLRRDGNLTTPFVAHSYTKSIAMSSRGVPGMTGWSKTSYTANRGSDYKTVVSSRSVNLPALAQPTTAPAPFEVRIPLTSPFAYTKGNQLLVQFETSYTGGNGNFYWYSDAQSYSSSASAGSVAYYGMGCPSGLTLYGSAPAINGTSKLYWYWYSAGGFSTPAMAVLGVSKKTWGAMPLPISLLPYGARGCYINTDMVLTFAGLTDASGTNGRFRVELNLPWDPNLAGLTVFGQTLVFDRNYNKLGLRASEGIEFKLGTYLQPIPAAHLYSYYLGGSTPFPDQPHYTSNTVLVLQLEGL